MKVIQACACVRGVFVVLIDVVYIAKRKANAALQSHLLISDLFCLSVSHVQLLLE